MVNKDYGKGEKGPNCTARHAGGKTDILGNKMPFVTPRRGQPPSRLRLVACGSTGDEPYGLSSKGVEHARRTATSGAHYHSTLSRIQLFTNLCYPETISQSMLLYTIFPSHGQRGTG